MLKEAPYLARLVHKLPSYRLHRPSGQTIL